ncbi:MAG: hypothetical protein ACYDIB_06430 [Desulfobulbia bacterium]
MTLHKVLFTLLLLPAFLFSDNALLFGKHAMEELTQATKYLASAADSLSAPSQPGTGLSLNGKNGSDHHEESDGRDCCDTTHSHAWTPCQPAALSYLPDLSSLFAFEPFSHLPEVFLAPFIPPQNLA